MGKRLAITVVTIFALSAFIASFFILYHQKVTWGLWFEIDQVLHHEFFALIFLAVGIGIIIGVIIFAAIDSI